MSKEYTLDWHNLKYSLLNFYFNVSMTTFWAVMRRTCCLCTVGQVVHTLPEGKPAYGVTLLGDEVFVLRRKLTLLRRKVRYQLEVYDVINYRLQSRLTMPNISGLTDMTSCEHYHCVYFADHIDDYIHRLDVQGTFTQWAVNDEPAGISVNAAHNVLVTCIAVPKIKEFSSHGDLLRELTLPGDVTNPLHSIQTRNDEFIVCHGGPDDAVHRVCKISADGRHIVQSHGGQPGSDIGQYDVPRHLAVDSSESVFVVDVNNERVTLLSPTLDSTCQIVSRYDLKWLPGRLCLDIHRRRLYVADNEYKSGEYRTGRVVVFNV